MKGIIVLGLSFLLICLFSGPISAADAADPGGSVPGAEAGRDGSPEESTGGDLTEDLEEEFTKLKEELRKLEQDAREKLKNDILPRIREEIQKLREKLRELDLEEDEPKYRRT